MKKTLSRLLALALTAAMVLTGCSSGGDTGSNGETGSEGESSASTSDTSEDAIKDLYIPRLAQRELQTFNILYTQRAEDGENLTSLVDGLLESNPKGELVPCIAEEWGSEDGGLTWTFKLRERQREGKRRSKRLCNRPGVGTQLLQERFQQHRNADGNDRGRKGVL